MVREHHPVAPLDHICHILVYELTKFAGGFVAATIDSHVSLGE
jgi:hypothetical protein